MTVVEAGFDLKCSQPTRECVWMPTCSDYLEWNISSELYSVAHANVVHCRRMSDTLCTAHVTSGTSWQQSWW